MALKFRKKDTQLRATHYIASTSLAIAHVNGVVIENFRCDLAAQGITSSRIEEWGTYQRRLHQLITLPFTSVQDVLDNEFKSFRRA